MTTQRTHMDVVKGSDIVCFPETSLSGLPRRPYADIERRITQISDASKSFHMWSVEDGVTPGTTNEPIETDFGTIGVINCWDMAFPDEVRRLTKEGAEIVLCPSYWIKQKGSGSRIEDEYYGLPTTRAFENQVFFVMCDAKSEETVGQSRILSPVSQIARTDQEGIISANVDLQNLDELRRRYNCWR